jgi:hypothetical protein
MAKKQLRTVMKSNKTGRLNRDEVRSAVIEVRDARMSRIGDSPRSGVSSARSNRAPSSVVKHSLTEA